MPGRYRSQVSPGGELMIRPWGRPLPRRALSMAGLAGSALLILYGAAEVAGEALAETGAIRPSAPDWTALRWHLALWDPWFLVWGLLLAAATWGYRRSARTSSRQPGTLKARG